MKRVPSLDGLRGIAIVFVLGRHLLRFTPGWTGVDLFFVLSGYLITTILLAERDDRHFWKVFYTRRVARIVPAYLLLVALSAALGMLQWRVLWPYLVFLGGNVGMYWHGREMETAGFGIVWSLAVEEHFYLLWPLQVRRLSQKHLSWILVGVVVLEPLARIWALLRGCDWAFIYYQTPFRLDGLALGSLLALGLSNPVWRERIRSRAAVAAGISLGAFVLALPWLDCVDHMRFCGFVGYSLVAWAAVCGLAYVLFYPESRAARMLSWRPLTGLGRISYGVYLFHELLSKLWVHVGELYGNGHGARIVLATMPLTILFAWLSFRFFESPIQAWARRRIAGYREEAAVARQAALDRDLTAVLK